VRYGLSWVLIQKELNDRTWFYGIQCGSKHARYGISMRSSAQ
jgi:hypothetical protein